MTKSSATAFAPSNIALIKYWGKRDTKLNLPVTSSLSVSLGELGTRTTLSFADQDAFFLNGKACDPSSDFANRLSRFLDRFRDGEHHFRVETHNNIPTAAGLASSASGFAALVKALNDLFGWQSDNKTLSTLARQGSGSASRSLFDGFVKWHRGELADGSDSYAEKISDAWPDLRLGIVMISDKAKPMSSRDAMNITTATAKRYANWPERVAMDLPRIEKAIAEQDFQRLGQIAENNALEMHACMEDAKPPISFTTPETQRVREQVWQLRADGVPVYFTQDAGPNIKLIFNQQFESTLADIFSGLIVANPQPPSQPLLLA